MSDPKNPNIEKRSTPQWSLYQRENFWKPNTGEVPLFNTGTVSSSAALLVIETDYFLEPGKLEELAKEKLSQGGWYLSTS